jgi:2-polyprenyl-3-methyl-5-hydroxy-6-metoxy-1,4-benzoquinol methylase
MEGIFLMYWIRNSIRMETVSSKERLHSFYDGKYKAEASAALDQRVEYKTCPSNRFEACVKFFPRYFHGGDILELGAGSGLVARSLIEHGLRFNTYTLSEVAESRLKGLSQNFTDPHTPVVKLDAESICGGEVLKYDAIIMLALIAQLVDPLGAMQHIRKLLKPGGFVFLETPNIAKYSRRAKLLLGRFPAIASRNEGLISYEGKPVGLHDEGHLHYFTFRSLTLMLVERCGFSRVEKLGYFVGLNGRRMYCHTLGDFLGRVRPELFSEIVLVAYA